MTSQSEIRRPGATQQIKHLEGATPRRPTLVVTDAGALRFVEPLECPTEEVVTETRATETTRGPNLATFVVGVIATAVGGIMLVRGANDDDGAGNPFTYAGAGLAAVGLPFAVGPWINNGTELRALADEPVRRPGLAKPCGERGLAAKSATLKVRGIEVFGAVDANGVFAISPFAITDAFDAKTATAAWDIAAKVDAIAGARTVEVVIDARTIAAHADAFLARGDFDPKIETMRLVPGLVVGTLQVSLTKTLDDQPVARVILVLKNDGPGPAFAVRGHLVAPGTPALDGRVLYFGHVAKGTPIARDFIIPLSAAAADALRNATIDLAIELRDAHGTAPTTPVRHRGPILVEPRR